MSFKGFLEKAKKKAEQFADEIAIKPTNQKPIEFNETFFTFKVEGGPKHTEMLVAGAKIKEGTPFTQIRKSRSICR